MRLLQCFQKRKNSHKKLKKLPSKVAYNWPKPFISQSSPALSQQLRIDFSYHKMSGTSICFLICVSDVQKVKKGLFGSAKMMRLLAKVRSLHADLTPTNVHILGGIKSAILDRSKPFWSVLKLTCPHRLVVIWASRPGIIRHLKSTKNAKLYISCWFSSSQLHDCGHT